MFDFIIYLGQSALCMAALYLIYKVAMSHETLHLFNRVLLLGSVVLSALLPLCRVKIVKEYDPAPAIATIEVDDMVVADVVNTGVDYVSLLKDVAVAIFLIGAAFMLVRLAVSTYSVWRLIHSGQMSVIDDDVTLTVVDSISSPFSWFGHIVASEKDMQEYRPMILAHELAHIRLCHSWDVLFMDFALCLWWFNPAMWLLRRELQSLHEYQADDAVLSGGVDAKNYQMMLIKRAVGSRLHSVANCLNHSNLKNRITMMCKKTSSRWTATKALLVVPMVAVAMSAFATTVYVPREVQDKVTENFVNEQTDEKPNPIVVIDGKVVAYEEMSKIDANTIKSVNVFKIYKEELAKYNIIEEDAKNGVVVIELKKDGDTAVLDNATGDRVITIAKQGETTSADIKVVGYSTRMKSSEQEQDPPYIKVEKMPTFYGGDLNAFRNWMQSQIQYPAEAMEKNISGRVIFSFVVEKDGSTSDYTVLASPDKSLADEVERIFKTCPKWEPGTQRGEKVRVKYTVPIVFKMQSDAATQMTSNSAPAPLGNDVPYIKVEKMPTFQGGDLNAFRNWMQSQIQYPAEAAAKNISGRVIFSFVVEKDGSTSDYTVLASPDKSLADEVERIFKTCPKWEPGTQRGEKVRVKYTVPVVFAMQGDANK